MSIAVKALIILEGLPGLPGWTITGSDFISLDTNPVRKKIKVMIIELIFISEL